MPQEPRPTDRETLTAMLARAGVHWNQPHPRWEAGYADNEVVIHAEGQRGPSRGYAGFHCTFTFTTEGDLDHIGIWE